MGSKVGNTSYVQKFRSEWMKDPLLAPWLTSVEGEPTKARCKLCKSNITARLKDIKDHMKTAKHTAAAQPFSPESRQRPLPFQPEKKPSVSLQNLLIAASLTLFVVCHAAIRSVDHLADMFKRVCAGFQHTVDLKLHRTKCSGVIKNVFYPFFRRSLQQDVGTGRFSLLLDESTDIAVHKQLGICIRYFSEAQNRIVDTFLCLVRLEGGDAASIVAGVKKALVKYSLSLSKLRAIGTDNANVMTGINAGVYALLKTEVPDLILIRCVCHSCHLAMSAAVQGCLPRSLEFLLSDTYCWFSRSSNRQTMYATLYKAINDGAEPLKIVQAAKTRWLSIEPAVIRILDQWVELKTHFGTARMTEKCYTAELLYSMYNDVTNELYLIFLKPVLSAVQQVNKAFQSNTADPSKLLQDLTLLISSLAKMVVVTGCRENLLKVDVSKFLHPRPFLGHEVELKISQYRRDKKLSVETEMAMRKRCIDFVICLVTELQQRLPDSVERLSLISELSPLSALKAVNGSIVPLAETMNRSPACVALIDAQWKKLNCIQWDCKTGSTFEFWTEVRNYRDALGRNPFEELVELAMECLILPWANAEIERLFSQMKILKTPHRNRISDVMLNALLTIRSGVKRHGKCCDSFDFPDEVLREIGTSVTYSSQDDDLSGQAATEAGENEAGNNDEDDFGEIIRLLD